MRTEFFEESTARVLRHEYGPADVLYSANTICHIPYLDSVLKGVDALLKPGGVFMFEDPYLGDVVRTTAFDQFYDEHFFYFCAHSVQAMAHRHGLSLVDVQWLPVHGGEVRYTLSRAGEREPEAAVTALLAEEEKQGLNRPSTYADFADRVQRSCQDLRSLLQDLRGQGKRVVGYGATAKSATVANYCGIGPELLEFVCDSTPAKQGKLTPGMHLPVCPTEYFASPYPDYALLFAWNHAEEIMEKETGFRNAGGQWIRYVPDVRIV